MRISDINNRIVQDFSWARKKLGMSINQASGKIEIPFSTLYKVEKGTRKPNLNVLRKMSYFVISQKYKKKGDW